MQGKYRWDRPCVDTALPIDVAEPSNRGTNAIRTADSAWGLFLTQIRIQLEEKNARLTFLEVYRRSLP